MRKKYTTILAISLLILSVRVSAQQAPVDSTFTYVAGEGLNIKLGKADGAKFNISSVVQPGIQYARYDSLGLHSNASRMSLNLVRISLKGAAFKDQVSFGLMTDFTGISPILEGWIGINVFNKDTRIILGQKQTNTNNRLAMEDERYSQVMAQSIAGRSNDGIIYGGLMQNFVGSTREGGVFFDTKLNLGNFKIYPSASVTTGEGQNFFDNQPNLGFKYGGRIDIMPFGDFIKNGAYIAHDLYGESSPKLAIGGAASYNSQASSPIGSANAVITTVYNKSGVKDYADYRKIVGDFIFKYSSFSLVGEFINGSVAGKELYTNAIATNKLTPQAASALYNLGKAFNAQTSYVFKNKLAIDFRYTNVQPEFDVAGSLVHQQNWYTAGINQYFKYNAVRVGLNGTYIEDTTPLQKTNKWVGNFAVQIIL
jgi:hypothetical protein